MKKILILASDMEIGGAERALLGLLEAIDKKQYQVDLFLLRHQGPFMRFIPLIIFCFSWILHNFGIDLTLAILSFISIILCLLIKNFSKIKG